MVSRRAALARELGAFGVVGLLAYAVDVCLFNLLRYAGDPGLLEDKPLTAKAISVVVATLVSYLGNRHWTWRHRSRRASTARSCCSSRSTRSGSAIALVCLAVSHYVLDLTSALADNISANVVGLVLATGFRFWAYRTHVFPVSSPSSDACTAIGSTSPKPRIGRAGSTRDSKSSLGQGVGGDGVGDHPVATRHRGQPGRQVDRCPVDVAQPHDDRAGGQANAHVREVGVGADALHQLERDLDGNGRLVGREEHGVAERLDHPAAACGDDVGAPGLERLDQRGQLVLVHPVGQRREAHQVGEPTVWVATRTSSSAVPSARIRPVADWRWRRQA